MVANLICFGIACFFFVMWAIQQYNAYVFRSKYTKAAEECQQIMAAYYFMGKDAARLRIKYNILFNTLISSDATFDGDFARFRSWADREGIRTFGAENPLDLKKIENHYKSFQNEMSKITNE